MPSRLGDNWHLAVTAAAVGKKKKKKKQEEGGRAGSRLQDPARAHMPDREQLRDGGWLRARTSVVTLSGSCALFLKHE